MAGGLPVGGSVSGESPASIREKEKKVGKKILPLGERT